MSNINSINIHRLSSYKHIFNCASDTEALKFYYWNQAVSAELYVLLHNIEVCLRNRIHEVLSFDASNQQSRNYTWFDKLYLKKPDGSSPPVYVDTVLGKSIKKISVHDKFHRTLVLSGFFFLKIASTFLNSSFFPKPIKRRIAI